MENLIAAAKTFDHSKDRLDSFAAAIDKLINGLDAANTLEDLDFAVDILLENFISELEAVAGHGDISENAYERVMFNIQRLKDQLTDEPDALKKFKLRFKMSLNQLKVLLF